LGSLVVSLSNSSKSFLAGSVPELDPDVLAFDRHTFGQKIYCQSALIIIAKFIIDESLEDVSLADPCVPYDDHFEEEIQVLGLAHYNYLFFESCSLAC
jgi:hypothetical protein